MSAPIATSSQPPKRGRIAKRALAAIGVVACIAIIAIVAVNLVFRAIDESLGQKQAVALSEQTALNSLNNSVVPAPDLSAYAYVDSANLLGPRFEDLAVGEVQHADDGTAQRTVSATASYRNANVTVTMPIAQHFTYDEDTTSWIGGDVEAGAPTVTPLRAPSTAVVEAAMPALLAEFDPACAERFSDCSMAFKPNMDETGGTVGVTLSKVEGDDKSKNKMLVERTVTVSVSWSSTDGWHMSIASAERTEETKIEEEKTPTLALTCEPGDLVELVGTVSTKSGRAVLTTDEVIQVEMGGQIYIVDVFELTAEGASVTMDSGSRATLQGHLNTGGSLEDAPLVLSVTG